MRVLVIGAGLSGLTAAGELVRHGHRVVVVDKGRAVGGRMASKRVGESRFDHGAQHFSVRSDEFRARVDKWLAAGVVERWYEGRSRTNPARGLEPRYRGVPHMRSISEHLAETLDVRLETEIDSVEVLDGRVRVVTTDGLPSYFDGVIITAPAPQALHLIRPAPIHPTALEQLRSFEYDGCMAAMLTLDRPTGWRNGHLIPTEGIIAWMSDNQHKGVSDHPAVTVHSTPEFAEKYVDSSVDEWLPALVSEAAIHIDARITASNGHRWRYSQPRNPLTVGAVVGNTRPPILFAGEAFSGARVEGAFLSGLAAARSLESMPVRQPAF